MQAPVVTALPSPSVLFSMLFAAVLLANVLVKLWLAGRQLRAVRAHRNEVPAEFAQTIPLKSHQRGADYTAAKLRLGFIELLLATVVLLAWTLFGGLDTLNRALLHVLGPRPLLQPLALLVAFAVIGGLIDLPASLYRTFVLEQRFGFNRMTPALWLADLVKGTLLGAVLGIPLAALLLWLMQATGAAWWFWAWLAWAAFSLLMLVVFPTLIAPLFNKFEPLQDETLKQRVSALMARCGFAAKGLFVMDGSRRSGHANAYFTGFGHAKRVVFFDTLLQQLTPDEVEAVLAHELGHYKRRHVIQRIVLLFAVGLAGLALLGWLAAQTWFYTGLGVTPNLLADAGVGVPNHALALLLFLLVVPVFSFFISPLTAGLSRKHEYEADAYAAEHARAADLGHALVKLHKDNASTLTPDPLYVRFYYSHPTASQRIAHLQAVG